jgi:hypothetical protein
MPNLKQQTANNIKTLLLKNQKLLRLRFWQLSILHIGAYLNFVSWILRLFARSKIIIQTAPQIIYSLILFTNFDF